MLGLFTMLAFPYRTAAAGQDNHSKSWRKLNQRGCEKGPSWISLPANQTFTPGHLIHKHSLNHMHTQTPIHTYSFRFIVTLRYECVPLFFWFNAQHSRVLVLGFSVIWGCGPFWPSGTCPLSWGHDAARIVRLKDYREGRQNPRMFPCTAVYISTEETLLICVQCISSQPDS